MLERELIAVLPRLRRYARALAGDPARADDLVQDTLERAWTKADLFEQDTDLRAWLFTLMHNVFINGLRAGRGESARIDPGGQPSGNDGSAARLESMVDERAAADGDAVVSDIGRALARLPEEQRAALLLVALEDMSYQDIARVQQVPIGTVMSRLARGRERLRLLLDSGHPTPLRRVK